MNEQISFQNMNYTYNILSKIKYIKCFINEYKLIIKFKHPNYPLYEYCNSMLYLSFPYDSLTYCDIIIKEYQNNCYNYYDYSLSSIEKLIEYIENIYSEIKENEIIYFNENIQSDCNNICNLINNLKLSSM